MKKVGPPTGKARFIEDGEIIDMETNDGGRAAKEFASEEEIESDAEDSDAEKTENDEEVNESDNEGNSDHDTSMLSKTEEDSDDESNQAETEKATQKSMEHMEKKIDSLSNSVKTMQEMLVQQNMESQQKKKLSSRKRLRSRESDRRSKSRANEDNSGNESDEMGSDTTIYQNILQKSTQNVEDEMIEVDQEVSFRINGQNDSSSSDDQIIDTSKEMMDIDEKSFSDKRQSDQRRGSTSKRSYTDEIPYRQATLPTKVNRRDDAVHELETNKARMFVTPGREPNQFMPGCTESNQISPPWNTHYSTMVDENYLVIGSHVDGATQSKILNNEYVDFAKLLPRDRVMKDDDHRMELINKGGQSFFVPVSDRESVGIHSFPKWEQTFRVFSNIYTRKFPSKAMDLIQYNHIIYTAVQSYVWENVYMYDREFRMHLSNYPQRSWAVILQQAWSMYLKDKIKSNNDEHHGRFGQQNPHNKYRKDECKRFNKGLCTAGRGCKYDHRCTYCGKFGHGAHICRKHIAEQGSANNKDGSPPTASGSRTQQHHAEHRKS